MGTGGVAHRRWRETWTYGGGGERDISHGQLSKQRYVNRTAITLVPLVQ